MRRSVPFALCALAAALAVPPGYAGTPGGEAAGAVEVGAVGDGPAYHPSSLLVSFEASVPAGERARVHRALGATVATRFERLGVEVVRLPDGLDPVRARQRYAADPRVARAGLNHAVRLHSTDALFATQWGLHNTGQPVPGPGPVLDGSPVLGTADVDVDAPEGWVEAFGTSTTGMPSLGGARVAVIDTGIDRAHGDLLLKTYACASAVTGFGTVVPNTCEDTIGHGTHVAGTIGAATGNVAGVAGVAPNVEFAVFKAFATITGYTADVVAGIDWSYAVADAHVVNMSFGGPWDFFQEQALDAAATTAVLVASAGNAGPGTGFYPALHDDVISVAAIDAGGAEAWFSSCNSDVEVAAPGVDVWSTLPGNSYGPLSGTSMAAPHVSGVAAMKIWDDGTSPSATGSAVVGTATGTPVCAGAQVVNLPAAL